MTTSTRSPDSAPTARPTTGTLTRRLAVLAVAAVVVNVVLALLLRAATGTSGDFLPLQAGPVAVATAVGLVAGVVLLLVLRRVLRRPQPVFVGLVVLGALLSLAGPLRLLGASPADQPGVTDAAALALVPLHLVPAAALLLVALPGRPARRAGA
jgi:hypothetical protein